MAETTDQDQTEDKEPMSREVLDSPEMQAKIAKTKARARGTRFPEISEGSNA